MANNQRSSVIASALLTVAATFVVGGFGLTIVSVVAIWGGGHISDLSKNLYHSPGTWLLLAVSAQAGYRIGQYYYRKKGIPITATSQKSARIAAIVLWCVFFAFLLVTSIRLWK